MYDSYPASKSKIMNNNCWYTYSPKLNKDIIITSNQEYNYWLLLEIDLDVELFVIRPVVLNIPKKYSPQFLVRTVDGVEKNVFLRYKENQGSTNIYKCNNSLVITNEYVEHNESMIALAKFILPYLGKSPNETDVYIILKFLKNRQKVNVNNLIKNISNLAPTRIQRATFHLILKGKINSNIKLINDINKLEVWVH
ncbi:hypothetical protein [Alkalihalobacillus sp. 1P02AB]|uniref:hypothetical protein n=1 Tax=Alkalihalobacillus sp. 1P02AB TaxID=3132260 RepID=UPI0039A43F0F